MIQLTFANNKYHKQIIEIEYSHFTVLQNIIDHIMQKGKVRQLQLTRWPVQGWGQGMGAENNCNSIST